MKVYNWRLPVTVKFKPKNWLFIAHKPVIDAVIVVASEMYRVRVSPEVLAKYPVTSMIVLKKPLGWVFTFDEELM